MLTSDFSVGSFFARELTEFLGFAFFGFRDGSILRPDSLVRTRHGRKRGSVQKEGYTLQLILKQLTCFLLNDEPLETSWSGLSLDL